MIRPSTGHPWWVVNERGGLGGNTPFEYATQVQERAFYGWPWYYLGAKEDPHTNPMATGGEGLVPNAIATECSQIEIGPDPPCAP